MGIKEVLEDSDEELTIDAVARELTGRNWPNQVDNLLASGTTQKYKILFMILLHNLDPLTRRSDLSLERAILLFKLGTKLSLDLIKVNFDRIIYNGSMKAKQYKLPYPSLIYSFLFNLGIPALPSARFSTIIPTFRITEYASRDNTSTSAPRVPRHTPSLIILKDLMCSSTNSEW